jgi:hypothetical protein
MCVGDNNSILLELRALYSTIAAKFALRTFGAQRGIASPPHVLLVTQEEVKGSVLSYMYIPCPACMKGAFVSALECTPSTPTPVLSIRPGKRSGCLLQDVQTKPNQTFWTLAQPRSHSPCCIAAAPSLTAGSLCSLAS